MKAMNINVLMGKTIIKIDKNIDEDELIFTCSDGNRYIMHHEQDCCESVTIDDVVGDLADLLNTPITLAECVEDDNQDKKGTYDDSFTWTFYKLATIKGYVNIKWYGTSNGYYSESVDFHAL